MAGVLLVVFSGASQAWKSYFDHKYEEAQSLVRAHGGQPYEGPRLSYHTVWHNVFCGLGDFGQDKGYRWKDRVAWKYARPRLQRLYGPQLPEGSPPYEPRIELVPEYPGVLREKILNDVAADPLWFTKIILKRIGRVLGKATPVSLAVGSYSISVGWFGYLLLPILLVLIWYRQWRWLGLIAFTVPTAATALLVYSGGGTPYYFIGHLVAAAVAVLFALEWALQRTVRANNEGYPEGKGLSLRCESCG